MIDPISIEMLLQDKLEVNSKVRQKNEICFKTCPRCGLGHDRFWVNYDVETFWCRKCGYAGHVTELLMNDFGMTREGANEALGKHFETGHTVYTYRDFDGKALFEVHKKGSGKDKKVWQTLPGNTKGSITPELRVLYNMQAALAAKTVYVVEGEKDVDTMKALGLVATSNPMGAGKFGLVRKDCIEKVFKDKNVVIIPDNDTPGADHADQVAERLVGIAKLVKIIKLPDLGESGDVTDYVQKFGNHKTMETLVDLMGKESPWSPEKHYQDHFEFMNQDEGEAVPPVVEWFLNQGENLLIAAEYGQMKSLLRMQLSLCIAAGRPFLGKKVTQQTVGVFQWENSNRLEKKRLYNMKNGLQITTEELEGKLRYADRFERFNLTRQADKEKLLLRCKQIGTQVLMFDNLSNMHTSNENDNMQMRQIVDVLSDINAELGTSTVLVHHMSKPSPDKDQIRHRIRGAISLQDWASTIISIMPVKRDRHETEDPIPKKISFEKVRDPEPGQDMELNVEFMPRDWAFVPAWED